MRENLFHGKRKDNTVKICPITLKAANAFVAKHHRHHDSVTGCKFAVSTVDDNGTMHGVAICGRPVSRHLDDGFTLEINRCCTDGTKNACSILYGACCRIAKNMGYERVITYTLASETGASLKASNFRYDGIAGGKQWTGMRRKDGKVPKEMKKRWVMNFTTGE